MKIQCDVCCREEALVFCCADEAALCRPCDLRIHRANKVAGRHRRLSLLCPSPSAGQAPPLCDVCQEKRGYVFCREDRALLCRDCDAPIHAANQLTARHERFLLTGVRLSSAPEDTVDSIETDREEVVVVPEDEMGGSSITTTTTTTTAATATSSISDYLLRTLPGWCVDDFLLDDGTSSAAATTNGFSQANEVLSFVEPVMEGATGFELWTQHAPQPHYAAGASIWRL